jgi:hypothetical protein
MNTTVERTSRTRTRTTTTTMPFRTNSKRAPGRTTPLSLAQVFQMDAACNNNRNIDIESFQASFNDYLNLISVEHALQETLTVLTTGTCPTRTKKVSFQLSNNTEHASPTSPEDLLKGYSTRDIKGFRDQKIESSKIVRAARDSTYDIVTARTYKACCAANMDTSPHDTLTPRERLFMMMQYRQDEVLGLESIAVKSITKDRSRRRRSIYEIVLGGQDILKPEDIRSKLERISLPSTLWARELAIAVAAGLPKPTSLTAC